MPRQKLVSAPKPSPAKPNQRTQATKALDSLGKVAARFEGFRPATDVLTEVVAVPTIFPQLNRATGVNGWPIQRIALIHGPSANGKTTLLHGLNLSFLIAGHFAGLVDAELTTPEKWLVQLMAEHAHNKAFVAMRPRSYEETAKATRNFAEVISKARNDGEIGPEVAGIVGVDSIRKLVPEKLLEKLEKEEGGIDGASGRAAMMRAALNAQWLDELAPLAYHANLAIVFIAREAENPNSKPWEPEFKVGGGKALVYDSSLVARVMLSELTKTGPKEKPHVIGEQHLVRITKSKVAGKDGKTTECFFHTSNGRESPAGFDRARDVFELAVRLKIIEQKAASYGYMGERLGIGELKAVQAIRENVDLMAKLEEAFVPGEGEIVE